MRTKFLTKVPPMTTRTQNPLRFLHLPSPCLRRLRRPLDRFPRPNLLQSQQFLWKPLHRHLPGLPYLRYPHEAQERVQIVPSRKNLVPLHRCHQVARLVFLRRRRLYHVPSQGLKRRNRVRFLVPAAHLHLESPGLLLTKAKNTTRIRLRCRSISLDTRIPPRSLRTKPANQTLLNKRYWVMKMEVSCFCLPM